MLSVLCCVCGCGCGGGYLLYVKGIVGSFLIVGYWLGS